MHLIVPAKEPAAVGLDGADSGDQVVVVEAALGHTPSSAGCVAWCWPSGVASCAATTERRPRRGTPRAPATPARGAPAEGRLRGGPDPAAVGRRNIITADMVKPGAVVIDVGMNRDDAGKLCGDVDFAGVKEVAGYITPVPGGVGPMTITMLLINTLEAAERAADGATLAGRAALERAGEVARRSAKS